MTGTAAGRTAIRIKDLKWLESIRSASDGGGMYPGTPCDLVPDGPARRLYSMGLIQTFIPHNSIHKERWEISNEGRAALAAAKTGSA